MTFDWETFNRDFSLGKHVNRVKLERSNRALVDRKDLKPGKAGSLINDVSHVVPFSHAKRLSKVNFEALKFALLRGLFIFFQFKLISS
jgi:hypothetical protein